MLETMERQRRYAHFFSEPTSDGKWRVVADYHEPTHELTELVTGLESHAAAEAWLDAFFYANNVIDDNGTMQ